jgi:hypothetical protein
MSTNWKRLISIGFASALAVVPATFIYYLFSPYSGIIDSGIAALMSMGLAYPIAVIFYFI